MNTISKATPIVLVAIFTGFAIVHAATPEDRAPKESSSYVYTKALSVGDSGVAQLPPSYQWSIETSWSGIDGNGRNLPDTRVMLRLHDPNTRFSAMTSQVDLVTAERIYRDLGAIIAAKRKDPNFQDRSHTGRHSHHPGVPIMRVIGIDDSGVAILEETENGG